MTGKPHNWSTDFGEFVESIAPAEWRGRTGYITVAEAEANERARQAEAEAEAEARWRAIDEHMNTNPDCDCDICCRHRAVEQEMAQWFAAHPEDDPDADEP